MKKHHSKHTNSKKHIPFIYRSFRNFWCVVVLPSTLIALTISKLYYNNTLNFEPLKEPITWVYFVTLQAFISFFTYLWVYRIKSKEYKK